MMSSPERSPETPGSLSVQDMVTGAAQAALRSGVHEMARATGKRGIVTLHVELCLGDSGEPLWITESVFFTPKLHHKDARSTNEAR